MLRRSIEPCQYPPIRYRERPAEAGAGSKGDSYDNAAAESLNGLYKTELIYRRRAWQSFDEVEITTLEWVDWLNRHRRLH
ncbi:MAG: ISBt3 transposase subunit protein [Chthonomonadaceae bacterium]|nr:ISBt3 transposase subunit protein [Chthonomonadaceae bacterium]